MQIQVHLWDRDTPPAFQEVNEIFLHSSFAEGVRQNIDLQAGVKVDIATQFETVRMVYIKTDGNEVRVYKNRSPEYWEVSKCWLAWDVDVSRISLMSPDGAMATVMLWGDRT